MKLLFNGKDEGHLSQHPSITMSINLNNAVMPKVTRLFVAGGTGIKQADIGPKNVYFTFARKKNIHAAFGNFLPNARRDEENVPFGIAVIYDAKMKLFMNLKVAPNIPLKMDETIEQYIKEHLVDLVVYGTDTATDRYYYFYAVNVSEI